MAESLTPKKTGSEVKIFHFLSSSDFSGDLPDEDFISQYHLSMKATWVRAFRLSD